jgi:hypothetical protein
VAFGDSGYIVDRYTEKQGQPAAQQSEAITTHGSGS